MQDCRFPKSEKIVSQKVIDQLFSGDGSHSLVAFPIRAVYQSHPSQDTPKDTLLTSHFSLLTSQVLVSVPKKRFKHAVDRNRVKRQLREAYRRHKHLLDGRSFSIAFVWIADTHFPSSLVEKRMATLLSRMVSSEQS